MQTTEQLNDCQGFDRYYYEFQRRWHIAPAIGRTALALHEIHGTEARFRDELIDGIAEAIPGMVNNTRSYETVNGSLVAENGEDMDQILSNGLKSRTEMAALDPFFQPFATQRARHELNEMREWQKMADGSVSHNTLLVLSPYSEEYLTDGTVEKLEQVGQDPKNKRAMLRVAHWDGAKLRVHSRSIDNSSLELLKQAAKQSLSYEFQANDSTEMLGERLKLSLSWQESIALADRFVESADQILALEKGDSWKQGRRLEDAVDTQKFVESQTQIIENLCQTIKDLAHQHHSYESYRAAWEQHLYIKTALIKERMERGAIDGLVDVERAAAAAGALAEARGESYNMCGMIITAKGENQNMDIGFESTKNLIDRKVQCPECKERVVLPTSKLLEGRLCCSNCKYEVDICTGEVKNISKPKKKRQPPKQEPKKETDWQRITRETKETQELKKARWAQEASKKQTQELQEVA